MLQLGTDKRIIGGFSHFFLFNISPYVTQSSICISSNTVNVGVPR